MDTGPVDGGGPGSCPSNADDLISDFAMDNGIQPVSGRSGGWYVYPDGPPGAFDPPKMGDDPYPIDTTNGNPHCTGPGAFRVKAMGFTEFGAAAATDFVPPVAPMVKDSYDATQYRGIAFWAKGTSVINHVQVKFPDIYTDPEVPSPVCALATGFPNNCSPYIVKLGEEADVTKYSRLRIDNTWRKFEILFADAVQDEFNPGYHRDPPNDKLDVAHLLGFAIQVNANFNTTPPTANNFELWIDDVEFMR